jgi:hypothetical protein
VAKLAFKDDKRLPLISVSRVLMYFTTLYELMTLYIGLEEKCDRVNRTAKLEEYGSRRETVGGEYKHNKNNS